MGGYLTTHVLDIAQGIPASQMTIQLWKLETEDGRTLLKTVHTEADGRTEEPLLTDKEFTAGTYELIFAVGAYFAVHHLSTTDPPFLQAVPVRFNIANPETHYHIPLLVSPWAYSTYRGS